MAITAPAMPAAAQPCEPGRVSVGGLNDAVVALSVWDPDGAGPAAPKLIAGGDFTLAGTEQVNHIAAWDPATGEWRPLGDGTDGPDA